MIDLVKPFRVMIPLGNYQRTDKLIWTAEGLADSKILQQELHFLEGNKHFILKTDQINLTYLTVLLTGKVERRNLYLQDKKFYLCHVPIKEVHHGDVTLVWQPHTSTTKVSSSLLSVVPQHM